MNGMWPIRFQSAKLHRAKKNGPLSMFVPIRGNGPEVEVAVAAKKKRNGVDPHCIRGMDVASHREMQRIQRLDNEKLAKTSEHAEEQKRKASNEWNGFWSTATKMEKKKRRKSLTVVEAKARKKEMRRVKEHRRRWARLDQCL